MNSKASHTESLSKSRVSYTSAAAKALALGALLSQPSTAQAVGFSMLSVDSGRHTLHVGVWYPSDAEVPEHANTPFRQSLALDAEISGQAHKLVLMSHGYGGWHGGHADTALALAKAGFVVAAPTHAGNTHKDMSASIDQWIIDRPAQISATIDYLQQHWLQRQALADGEVGIYGFSAGGLTAMSLIGAVPNLNLMKQHCTNLPEEFGCKTEALIPALLAADLQLADEEWGFDARIGAAAVAAPGLAFSYDANSVANVDTPVQLWSGLDDKRVLHESNSLPLAQMLGDNVETHWIADANHFAFIVQSCTERLKKVEPETWAFLCVDKAGFDRKAFHREMNAQMAEFFEANL